ncbi:MAG: hypothetical protein KAJ19_00300 [Gammaproteobacteria bacterium]|nr:hypothetical protein [Gammaproteobacteria bacterium]
MGMPTEEELKQALAEAARMRVQDDDPQHVAKTLLNMNYRLHQLEKVAHAAELYFRSGMAVQEQQKLKVAMDKARSEIDRTAGIEEDELGLI